MGHNFVGTEHLFIALTRNETGQTSQLLHQANLNPRQVRAEIRREIGTSDDPIGEVLPLTPRTEIVLSLAIFLAEQDDIRDVGEMHILMAMLQEGEGVPMRKLVDLGFDINFWLQKLITRQQNQPGPIEEDLNWDDSDFNLDISDGDLFHPLKAVADGETTPTPLLNRYGRDLTAQAAAGKIAPAIAREREIRSLARTLARSKKNNPLLLGDAGVGKTAIVEGLAYAIHDKTAPPPVQDYRIVQIEIGTLVAGTSLRGQFEERLIGIVDEVKRAENIILFIDEIHTIVGAGDTIDSNLDAANILKPALARGEIKCIGATTHEEYRRAIAQDPALARRFRTIDVDEPTEMDSVTILESQRRRLENHHEVRISADAIEAAVRLSTRYLADRRLPDKALDLLDEACTRVTIQTIHPDLIEPNGEQGTADLRRDVTPNDIAAVLSEWTGIPVQELTKDEKRRLVGLEDALKRRVIGQDHAICMVADAIKTARTGLNDPNRPIGVFLFLGTSGVGKTELARALAEFLFGTEDAMLRLDMSEFHDAHTVARLIGAPPGYKDHNRGGQLTDGLRRRPYSVVLLDEIEKAAPEVFDIFLQIFDEGRLSDAHGRRVDARHAVFIMTSNIGTQESARVLGFNRDETGRTNYAPFLKQRFRVEFLNRIDEVVTFQPLTQETLAKILEVQIEELRRRLREQGLHLEVSEAARAYILEDSYDPVNGARPLRRAVERLLTRPLSSRIVGSHFESGATVLADMRNGTLHFETNVVTD